MIAVWPSPGLARPVARRVEAATASLAARVVTAGAAADALAVVGGDGWCQDAQAALADGARAVFALHPRGGDVPDLDALRAVAGTRAVLLERRRRPGAFAARVAGLLAAPPLSTVAPALIDVAVSAPRDDLADALADAAGWAALLAGTAGVRPTRRAVTDHGALGLLSAASADGASPVAVTVSATALAAGEGVLRATLLAPARLEVEIDLDTGARTATVTDELAVSAASPSFEDPVRAALRHALDRVNGQAGADDLDALRRDRACADALLGRASRHKAR